MLQHPRSHEAPAPITFRPAWKEISLHRNSTLAGADTQAFLPAALVAPALSDYLCRSFDILFQGDRGDAFCAGKVERPKCHKNLGFHLAQR